MKKVYIAFAKDGLILGTGIKLWTLGKYSHCELIIDGVSMSAGGMENSVRSKIIDYNKNPKKWDLYEVAVPEGGIDKIKKFFSETDKLKYDYKGIALSQFLWFFNKHDKDRYFCSEWCLTALNLAHDESLMHTKTTSIKEKGPNKFSPVRLHKYLALDAQLLLREVTGDEVNSKTGV